MLLRLVDALKVRQITGFFTSLSTTEARIEQTDVAISSLIDTWLLVRDLEIGGERNRGLYVLKSRGMQHSNQIREFSLTPHGIELREPYTGPAAVLTGSRVSRRSARPCCREGKRSDASRRSWTASVQRWRPR